jgi:hypothetical protein
LAVEVSGDLVAVEVFGELVEDHAKVSDASGKSHA